MVEWNQKQEKLRQRMLSPLFFKCFTFFKVPMVFFSGVKIEELNQDTCIASVPFKFINKNPFKSIYFAVQAMAAELSTAVPAMLALEKYEEKFAFIVVDVKAEFQKKATDKVYFTCYDFKGFEKQLDLAFQSGEPCKFTAKTIGVMKDGTQVANFEFTWSFKLRSK